jgi:hypothetical protein
MGPHRDQTYKPLVGQFWTPIVGQFWMPIDKLDEKEAWQPVSRLLRIALQQSSRLIKHVPADMPSNLSIRRLNGDYQILFV